MADPAQPYALARLILDYFKAFAWPALVLVVVFVFQDDARTVLRERQVDILGVRIGERVEEIESQALAEIEDLRALLERSAGQAPDEALEQDIRAKLDSFERSLSREVAAVGSDAEPRPLPTDASPDPAASRGERAAAAEREGFEALLARDLDAAIVAFERARSIWPSYHNVDELTRRLKAVRRETGGTDVPWGALFREILTKWSWGMPTGIRPQLREAAVEDY